MKTPPLADIGVCLSDDCTFYLFGGGGVIGALGLGRVFVSGIERGMLDGRGEGGRAGSLAMCFTFLVWVVVVSQGQQQWAAVILGP